MQIEIVELILKLKNLRKGKIPQMAYFADIFPTQVIKVRNEILNFKRNNPDSNEIDFIINSPGGYPDDAYRIIRTLRKNFETVNIIVPFWAKSAATLLALGGSKIIMDEFAEFGPLDVQVGKAREDSPEFERESALNDEFSVKRLEAMFKELYESIYIRVYEHKKINIPKTELSNQLLENLPRFFKPLLKQINPYKLGEKRRKLDVASQYATRILSQFNPVQDQSKVRILVDYLVDGCPDHGYIIDYDIISVFLENVYSSLIFGNEYKDTLSQLSIKLLESEEIELIGFIDESMIPKPQSADSLETPLKSTDTPETPLRSTDTPEIPLKSTDTPEIPLKSTDTPEIPLKSTDTPETPLKSTDTPEIPLKSTDTPEITHSGNNLPENRLKVKRKRK